ncbi:MAG: Mo-dependent nitrogenase C-terminal domain-containing protein [Xenococcaceae cyanobacterium]
MTNLNSINSEQELLHSVRQWLESIEVHNPKIAKLFCRIIPGRCPFEQEIKLFDRTIFRIPPLCKLNPLYEELVDLRFRCLSYLGDECGEDIKLYY